MRNGRWVTRSSTSRRASRAGILAATLSLLAGCTGLFQRSMTDRLATYESIERLLKQAKELGYDGYVGLECSPKQSGEEAARNVWRADNW